LHNDVNIIKPLMERYRVAIMKISQYYCVWICRNTEEKISRQNEFAYDKWLVSHWRCLSVS